jgi:SAM-dependent methyltransferase
MICVQFGCGLCAPKDWINFDSSPSLRLQKLPLIGRFIPAGPFGRFPSNVRYGDIEKGLPLKKNSVDLLYCSHVLEHLSLVELRVALQNCLAVLKPAATFVIVMPDLEALIGKYTHSTDAGACSDFMRETYLGAESRRHGIAGFVREWLGGSRHYWLWDYKGIVKELADCKFEDIHRLRLEELSFKELSSVVNPERWQDALCLCAHKGV